VTGFWPQFPEVRDMLDGTWVLTRGMAYRSTEREFFIPAGFRCDMGSVPEVVDWIIPACATKADPAYILHDFLYGQHRGGGIKLSRLEVDLIFRQALIDCGVSKARTAAIYWAVRAFGWRYWD